MRTPNYRQARRNREESRKAKQQQKLERKQNRGTVPETTVEPAPSSPEKEQGDAP